jgi:HK97 family phage major capsid protein
MKTVSEQIADLEATRASKAARMGAVMQKSVDEGRSTDQSEAEEFDTLKSDIETIDGDLVRLKALEKLVGEKAAPVNGSGSQPASNSREGVTVKNTEKLEPGIEFARYVMCQVAAKGDHAKAFRIAETNYPQNERIVKTLQHQANGLNLVDMMKTDIAAGTTTGTTWLAPLVDFQNFAGDFVEFLRPQTIIGKFGQGGVPSLNRIPFNVRITGQTSGGAGYWVGEGAPKPLTKFDFNATELRWAKVANIAVLTEESIRFSNPSAERLVRDALAAALIERLDIDFVDPGKAAVTNVSPASITNGVSPISPSGSGTLANIRTDIKALWAPFIAANNPPTSAVYIMSATTALALSLIVESGSGMPAFPGITMNGGTFNGVPVIVSEYLDNSAGSAGSIVILANARDIWLADDGQVNVDASREASLQMMDNPTNNSATPTHTTMVSMFQTNSVAIRAERFINWAKRRSSAVSWLDGVNWGTGV